MNENSLEAYSKVDLTKSERETVEYLARYGPASQAVLIGNILREERFADWEDARRVKYGQNLYARLHGLKAQGIAVITGTAADPFTGNTVDVYALNPVPPEHGTAARPPSLKTILKRLEEVEEKLAIYGDAPVSAKHIVALVRKVRDP